MKTVNDSAKLPKKKKKKPLKRHIFCEVELGVYFGGEDCRRYVSWWADLPGKRGVCAVQRVTEPKRLSNEKRNPVLFRHEYDTSYLCGIDGHKKVTILTGHALYHVIRQELERITRPVVRARSEESEWIEFEPGAVTDVLGRWRSQVLEELASKCGIADHSQHLETIYQVEAEQAALEGRGGSS